MDPKKSVFRGIDVEGDGDCFYRAICVAVGAADTKENSDCLKRQIWDARRSRYDEVVKGKVNFEPKDHEKKMLKKTEWNQASDILLAADVVGKPILVLQVNLAKKTKRWAFYGKEVHRKRGEIYLKKERLHYKVITQFQKK